MEKRKVIICGNCGKEALNSDYEGNCVHCHADAWISTTDLFQEELGLESITSANYVKGNVAIAKSIVTRLMVNMEFSDYSLIVDKGNICVEDVLPDVDHMRQYFSQLAILLFEANAVLLESDLVSSLSTDITELLEKVNV